MNRDLNTEVPNWILEIIENKEVIFECREYVLA